MFSTNIARIRFTPMLVSGYSVGGGLVKYDSIYLYSIVNKYRSTCKGRLRTSGARRGFRRWLGDRADVPTWQCLTMRMPALPLSSVLLG